MSTDGQRTKWHRNIAEYFNQFEWGARMLQTTDRRRGDDIYYSERERSLNYAFFVIWNIKKDFGDSCLIGYLTRCRMPLITG